MSRSSKTFPLLIALAFPSLAWADGTLVLPPLIPKGVDQKVATNVTSLLSTELDFSGNFETINELTTLPATLKEACLAQTTCLQGIAKANAGQAVVAGTIGPGPEGIQLYLVYYDAQKNTIVRKKTYNMGKEPSAIADRATSMVKELLSGESTAAAKAEAAPVAFTAPAEDDDFAFDAPAKSTTAAKTTTTKTTAPTSGKTRPTPTTAAPKSLEDEGEDEDAPVSLARSDSRDEPEYEEPEEAEKAAAAKAAALAQAKAEAEARASAKARADAEIRARNEAAAKAKADAEARARADAEARARAEAEAQARAEAEAQAEAAAAAQAEAAAAAQAKADAAARAKADADERARAAAQAKADAAAAAAARTAVARTAPAATADDDIFSFGSGSGAIEIESEDTPEPVEEAPKKSYYDHSDTSSKTTASSRYTDLDAPAPRSAAATKTRPVVEDEEETPAPVKSTSSSRTSTARTADPEESLDDEPVEDPDDYTDLDEEPPSRSSSSSRSAVADSSERATSSRDDTRSNSKSDSEARTTRPDDDKPSVTVTGRGGYARFYDFNFVTYGGEAGIPMGRSAALLVGIEGFSTQRHFSPADIATIAAETGQDPTAIPSDPWNTILPFNFGVVYKSSTHAVRPYAGVDIILAPYTETFDLAVGARVRAGADFMVAETFGLNLNLSGGILSGKEFEKIDPQVKNTGLLPQLSAGTVFSF